MNKYLAEALGTFCLIFAGTGAIIVNDVSGGAISHLGVALTFGLVVMAMIYAIGDISGAHINPAVTIGFWMARRFDGAKVAPYLLFQLLGAISATLLLKILFPSHATLGATLPVGTAIQSFVLEIVLTFMLMFVVLNVSTGSKEKGIMAGAAVGALIAFEAIFAGPISGASMNPVRSLTPALVSWQLADLWVYLTAPVLGALLAVPAHLLVQPRTTPMTNSNSKNELQ